MPMIRFALAMLLAAAPAAAQPAKGEHHTAVNTRGDHAMGFSHDKTTHHFRISKDGGSIDVSVNDGKDRAGRDAIRGIWNTLPRCLRLEISMSPCSSTTRFRRAFPR